MKTDKQLITYTERLATISLFTLLMAFSVAAESADSDRHKRNPTASRQQDTASYRVSDNRTARRTRGVTRVNREDKTTKLSNSQRLRDERRVSTTGKASDPANRRQAYDGNRVARRDTTTNSRNSRRARDNDRRTTRYSYRYHNDRNPGFFGMFNHRSYTSSHRYSRYIPLIYGGSRYFYNNGAYYRYTGFGFTLINNNIGVFLYSLPYGYHTLWIGDYPYYFVNRHFYIRDYVRNVYVQVEDPYQTAGFNESDDYSPGYQELIVYPAQGQTDEQMKQDKYECYLWAVDQTGFDPSLTKEGNIEDYQRAQSACLEGRGYVVN